MNESVADLKKALAELDDMYLTPRTIAGLAIGDDEIARKCWEEHERLAQPLREALAKLQPDALTEKLASLNGK